MQAPQPSRHEGTDLLDGDDQATSPDAALYLKTSLEYGKITPVSTGSTASQASSLEGDFVSNSDPSVTLFHDPKLNGEDLHNLFQLSHAGELSPLVLPMLHLASNNLLPRDKASDVVGLILSGSTRRLFNALISTCSPATQAIARSLLTAAIEALDTQLVRSLLDTGISANSSMGYSQQQPLSLAVEKGSMDITQLLVSYGAQVDYLSPHHWPSFPLATAAAAGRNDLV